MRWTAQIDNYNVRTLKIYQILFCREEKKCDTTKLRRELNVK